MLPRRRTPQPGEDRGPCGACGVASVAGLRRPGHHQTPDETRTFELGRVDLLKIGESEIGRLTLQPGWRWSEHVKPLAGTDLCLAPHFQYHVQGTLHVVMADGAEFDAVGGDVTALPQGHDAWVVGDEPVVVVDWWGASTYARG